MNDLIASTKDKKMTSLDIARITGKLHKNVMQDIRKEIDELGEKGRLIFQPSDYIDSRGKNQPCFEFGNDGAYQIALKYDANSRYNIIQYAKSLENRKQEIDLADPKTMLRIVQNWNDEVEKNTELTKQIKYLEPKGQVFDTYLDTKGIHIPRQAFKMLGLPPGIYTKKLFKMGVFYKVRGNNHPYEPFMQKGYFEMKTVLNHKQGKNHPQCMVTTLGQAWLSNIFKDDITFYKKKRGSKKNQLDLFKD